MIHNFRELDIWKRGIQLATEVYSFTRTLPADERFGMVTQMNRSAFSIPSNIAEGAGYRSSRKFLNYLDIAMGSSCELETHFLICQRVGLMDGDSHRGFEGELHILQRKIAAFRKRLETQRD